MGGRSRIAPRPARDAAPLSFAQRRLWFLQQLDPGRPGASTPLALRIDGPLDEAALQQALDAVVARHDALRMRLVVGPDGEPQQVVDDAARVRLAVLAAPPAADGTAGSDADAALDALLAAEVRRPFDLARAPLARATLVRRGPASHVFLLVVHHAVFDAWSRGIVRRELTTAYAVAVRGETWAPAALPIAYADYAAWQRGDGAAAALAADEAYWVDALAGAPRTLALPGGGGAPSRPGAPRAATTAMRVPLATADGIRALARREGATPFMVLLAAYETVLARCTGADDFLVGVVVSGRTRTEVEPVVGCFVNTLPLRARTDGDPSLQALVARVRTAAARAFAHQTVPFERLVERLNPERAGATSPLVQATFNFRNLAAGEATVPGLAISPHPVPVAPESAGLSLDVDDGRDGMTCVLAYDTARVGAAEADALLADFRTVLDAAVADPECRLSALPPAAAPAPTPDATRAAFDALYARTNLTAMQLLIWLHEQRHAGVPLYNQAAIRVWNAPTDAAAFGRAFAALVARSEALRTTVTEHDGVPRQTVHAPDERPPAYEVLDFSDRPDPLEAAREWARARGAAPLDLGRRSYDTALLRLDSARVAWYFATHHLVTDGWLRAILGGELLADYRAECAGDPAPPRPTPPPFADVVAAERATLGTAAARAADAYWAALDRREPLRPYGRTPRGGVGRVCRLVVPLGADRTARLRTVAAAIADSPRGVDAAAANLCAAAVCGALHRVSGGEVVTLAVPLHNRRTDATRRTHGLVMRVVPVRVPVHRSDRFDMLARVVASGTAAGGAHAQHGAGALAAAGADVVFNFQPATSGDPVWVDWLHPGWAAEPLAVNLHDYGRSGALTLSADFREDVYDAPTRALFVRHALATLDAALADPATRVGDVDLLGPEERARVLAAPHTTATALPEAATILDLIAAQARRTPGALAVSQPGAGRAPLTYAELWEGAERIAAALRRAGVGRGDLVGLLLDRSPTLITAMLGVMRAGAAYVPLDPAYPAAHLATMASAAALALCLTERALLHRFPVGAGRTVCVDAWDDASDAVDEEADVAPAAPGRDDLAYVIYTSGSTGTPKGVEIPHAALLNFVCDVARRFTLGPGDRFLQFASPSFDTSVEEIFPPLVAGGAVVLRDDGWIDSLPAFVARCEAAGVTAFSLPTAFWHELVDALARGTVALPSGLRLALVGGERMRADRLAEWRRVVGARVPLWNGYGPTEATVVATFCDLTPAGGEAEPDGAIDGTAADVAIGLPIANMRAYVLDGAGEPAPVGVPGELFIGGLGLARGYRGQPALTAERFVADPFTSGARLYRTGDRARVRPDGAFEVIGRVDGQVKVRGFRVEPGEVEAALLALPMVRDGIVAARDDTAVGPRLVAYVVAVGAVAGEPPVPDVRAAVLDALRQRLPEHMVPAAVVVLPALPHTPNGKVDRRALPAPGAGDAGAAAVYAAPVTAAERAIAAVWEAMLGVPRVGRDDDFFALGGHSLLAVRVMTRVREVVGGELPLRALFEARTVARVAALADDVGAPPLSADRPGAVTPLEARGTRPPIFWLHGDYDGGGRYCRRLARLLGPDQPFYAVHPFGVIGDPVPHTIEAMARRHEADIRAVCPRGPYRLGGHCNGGVLAFEVARRLRARGEVVEHVVMVDAGARNTAWPALLRWRLRVSRPIGRVLRRWLGRASLPGAGAVRDPASRRSALDALYGAALWTYVPRQYGGRVTVLLSATRAGPADRARLIGPWRHSATALAVDVVPGDHIGCLTVHADALAARLRTAFG
ncbi:MAG TPA: amino acid adenylation domain-containing protein [Gemmatirosa sp.]